MKVCYYFKIFDNIKSEDEVNILAELELKSLFGKVSTIHNFYDKLSKEPLKSFTNENTRIQDFITLELPYGRIQGYYRERKDLIDISKLIKRLAYTREIYVIICESIDQKFALSKLYSEGKLYKNVQVFKNKNRLLFRFITNQYFLEKSIYISKLSRNEKEIDINVDILFNRLTKDYYRIPASSTLSVGKRLEDYFTIREEPSLYLNHYMHPYKGKFHPKMVRALLNYIHPDKNGTILDNFAGSGTSLVEANYIELNSKGAEINPLSVLMCNVKCSSVKLPIKQLKLAIKKYLDNIEDEFFLMDIKNKKDNVLLQSKIKSSELDEEINRINEDFMDIFKINNEKNLLRKIITAKMMLKFIKNKEIHDFILLTLSGTISDLKRRRKKVIFYELLKRRINDLYLRIYLFKRLNKVLNINLGSSKCITSDTRKTSIFNKDSIDGIINSPPYSTALDYIKNDKPQLILLDLVESWDVLERDMIGNPRVNFDKNKIALEIERKTKNPSSNKLVTKYINLLQKGGRKNEALRLYKFSNDMYLTLKEMHRVMKDNSKCAIVIGNNNFLVNHEFLEIPNDDIILEIGNDLGFKKDLIIKRELHKSSIGNIRKESIVILQK